MIKMTALTGMQSEINKFSSKAFFQALNEQFSTTVRGLWLIPGQGYFPTGHFTHFEILYLNNCFVYKSVDLMLKSLIFIL